MQTTIFVNVLINKNKFMLPLHVLALLTHWRLIHYCNNRKNLFILWVLKCSRWSVARLWPCAT